MTLQSCSIRQAAGWGRYAPRIRHGGKATPVSSKLRNKHSSVQPAQISRLEKHQPASVSPDGPFAPSPRDRCGLVRLSEESRRKADEGVGRGPGVPPHIRTYSANLEHETPDQPLQLNFPDDIPSPCALLTGTGRNKLPADCP